MNTLFIESAQEESRATILPPCPQNAPEAEIMRTELPCLLINMVKQALENQHEEAPVEPSHKVSVKGLKNILEAGALGDIAYLKGFGRINENRDGSYQDIYWELREDAPKIAFLKQIIDTLNMTPETRNINALEIYATFKNKLNKYLQLIDKRDWLVSSPIQVDILEICETLKNMVNRFLQPESQKDCDLRPVQEKIAERITTEMKSLNSMADSSFDAPAARISRP